MRRGDVRTACRWLISRPETRHPGFWRPGALPAARALGRQEGGEDTARIHRSNVINVNFKCIVGEISHHAWNQQRCSNLFCKLNSSLNPLWNTKGLNVTRSGMNGNWKVSLERGVSMLLIPSAHRDREGGAFPSPCDPWPGLLGDCLICAPAVWSDPVDLDLTPPWEI